MSERQILYDGYWAAGSPFMAYELGHNCLAEIKGEKGVARHNLIIHRLRTIVDESVMDEMLVKMAEVVLRYARLTNDRPKQERISHERSTEPS